VPGRPTAAEPATGPVVVDPTRAPEAAAAAIPDDTFANLMIPLGPFEPATHLAVGVSGGSDSLALVLLADRWARQRGGGVTALTVDHRLRPQSAAEAGMVRSWLAARDIEHRVLTWREPHSSGGVQAAARAARLRLLGDWCRRKGVLHLMLAHQLEDQAETLLERLSGGSGVDGLAGMPQVRALGLSEGGGGVRILRPLLSEPAETLKATLAAAGQHWIDDPSNRNERFARGRLAAVRGTLSREGLTSLRLAHTATRAGRDRAALEREVAAFMVDHVRLRPCGHAWVTGAPWQATSASVFVRALARLVAVVGGNSILPPLRRVERLAAALCAPESRRGYTLAGCRLLRQGDKLLAARENGRIVDTVTLKPGDSARWDGRFDVSLAKMAPGPVQVRRLSQSDVTALRAQESGLAQSFGRLAVDAPVPALKALPGFHGLDGRLTVPHLEYRRPGQGKGNIGGNPSGSATFRANLPLAPGPFGAVRI